MPEGPPMLRGAALRHALAARPPRRRRAVRAAVRSGVAVEDRQDLEVGLAVARRTQRRAQLVVVLLPIPAFVLWVVEVPTVSTVLVGAVVVAYGSTLVLGRAVRSERLHRGALDLANAPQADVVEEPDQGAHLPRRSRRRGGPRGGPRT